LEIMLFDTGLESLLASKQDTEAAGTRRGRHPISPEVLLPVADAYAQALAAGDRRPIKTIAAALNLKKVRARDLVHRSRLRGFLTNTPAGRAGGALTPEARALLKMRRQQLAKGHPQRRRRR
jgi:hypothetical protein